MKPIQISELLSKLKNLEGSAGQYTALCPAHDDKTSSLSISSGNDGRILLHCHAGCDTESIIRAIGIEMSDLFAESTKKDVPAKKGKRPYNEPPEAEYLYYDTSANVVHKTIRNGKQYNPPFSQARPDPSKPGKWIYNLKDIQPIIYYFGS